MQYGGYRQLDLSRPRAAAQESQNLAPDTIQRDLNQKDNPDLHTAIITIVLEGTPQQLRAWIDRKRLSFAKELALLKERNPHHNYDEKHERM